MRHALAGISGAKSNDASRIVPPKMPGVSLPSPQNDLFAAALALSDRGPNVETAEERRKKKAVDEARQRRILEESRNQQAEDNRKLEEFKKREEEKERKRKAVNSQNPALGNASMM